MNLRILTTATVLAAVTALAVTGCTNPPVKHHLNPTPAKTSLVDPILELTDSSSPAFVATSIVPNIEVQGTGPRSFTIARPSDPKAEIQFYVICAPASSFTLTMGGFFSSGCGRQPGGIAAIPVSQTPGAGELTVKIDIPRGTHYWIVGIPYNAANG